MLEVEEFLECDPIVVDVGKDGEGSRNPSLLRSLLTVRFC